MQSKRLLMLLICQVPFAYAAHQVTITTKIVVDSAIEQDVVNEARHDSKSFIEKYAGVRGVRSVEATVDSDRCSCNKPPRVAASEDAPDKCGCTKPKPVIPSANEECVDLRCDVCGKPKPEQKEEAKCGCTKPRPPSVNE